MRIVQARSRIQFGTARRLIEEYAELLDVDLEFQNFSSELMQLSAQYAAPNGCLLLAYFGARVCGCVALRRLSGTTGEMKRLYVRPQFRGHAIGLKLVREIVRRAALLGYSRVRLDTLPSMREAIALYRSLGFVEIAPYRANPVPGSRFLELKLQVRASRFQHMAGSGA